MENNNEMPKIQDKITQEIEFKYIDDILYYDGPLIALGFTHDNTAVLQECLDMKQHYGLYAYVFITHEDVLDLLENKKRYYDVLKGSYRVVMFKYYHKAYDFEEIDTASFLAEYGPEPDASLLVELQDFHTRLQEYVQQDESLKSLLVRK